MTEEQKGEEAVETNPRVEQLQAVIAALTEQFQLTSGHQVQHENVPDMYELPEGPERRFHEDMASALTAQRNALFRLLTLRQQQLAQLQAEEGGQEGETEGNGGS